MYPYSCLYLSFCMAANLIGSHDDNKRSRIIEEDCKIRNLVEIPANNNNSLGRWWAAVWIGKGKTKTSHGYLHLSDASVYQWDGRKLECGLGSCLTSVETIAVDSVSLTIVWKLIASQTARSVASNTHCSSLVLLCSLHRFEMNDL